MKLTLLLLFHLISGTLYCQTEYSLIIEGSNIRVWKSPQYSENYSGETLAKKEAIVLINKQIQDLGNTTKTFYSFYRKNKPQTLLYFLSSEIDVQLSKRIIVNVSDAIIAERIIKYIFLPCSYTSIKKGDVLSISNTGNYNKYRSAFTLINTAAISISDALDRRARGLFVINSIHEYETRNDTRTFLECKLLNNPLNSSTSGTIYIDYDKATESGEIQMHQLGEQNDFTYLLISATYLNSSPQEFYDDYLSFFLGKDFYSGLDEFQKRKLITDGQAYLDSIYSLKTKAFEFENKNVFVLNISDYDFSKNCYYIKELSEDLEQTLMFNSISKFCQPADLPGSQRGFINLRLFDSKLKIEPDKAEKFLKEASNRRIIVVAYFHWLNEIESKDFSKKYNIEPETFSYQKVIDSLVIYSNKGFEQPWFTIYPGDNDQSQTKPVVTIPASFPGGDAKFHQFVERNFKKNTSNVIRVDYKLKVKVDGSVEFIDLKTSNPDDASNIQKLILTGPKWQPAIIDGKQSESILEGYWLF